MAKHGKIATTNTHATWTSCIDRYKCFLEIYPEHPNRVPQKMIASYIGVMPQTLSTIRSKITKGE